MKKRATIIAWVHLALSITVFFVAIGLTAKSMPNYPEYVHPPAFVILQRIVNFPFVLLVSYMLLFMVKTFQMKISVYTMFAVTVATMPLNSSFCGFCIDKVVSFIKKEKT
ncbi:MAG: hypothetical protein KAS92_05215 [Candidatus Omnitrophica bacterium]|nr:hypothetical protein [Candidatus Omnitrophota bacterium]MCK5180771.1 hypothetical protein [Candidatus Omnitrophota bacterium]